MLSRRFSRGERFGLRSTARVENVAREHEADRHDMRVPSRVDRHKPRDAGLHDALPELARHS